MSTSKIAFIGAGNMAKAIMGGMLAEGYTADRLIAAGPRRETLDKVKQDFQVEITTDNKAAAAQAEVVILAVKPQMLKEVSLALRDALAHKPLIISVAAGITTESLANWLGEDQAIVRSMPNTPSQLRNGASGVFANARVSDAQKSVADAILGAVGIVQWLEDESLLNPVTAVSGSGPAYFFLFMEAMIEAGEKLGLSRECATELTVQTALGAALLAKESKCDVAELRRRVTSPKGTTEQAINSFEQDQLRETVLKAMTACSNRALELSKLLGN
ncbi:MAG TPA: pyrroline-5-carboxylate reductase [Cellvibrio sp.]|nr:pyrroline-5-carboxylate reductase [Cellvibrio sp.]